MGFHGPMGVHDRRRSQRIIQIMHNFLLHKWMFGSKGSSMELEREGQKRRERGEGVVERKKKKENNLPSIPENKLFSF